MANSIYAWRSLRQRHQNAPLLIERERYLSYLANIGIEHARIRAAASTLLNVIQALGLTEVRPVRLEEIKAACESGDQHRAAQGPQLSLIGNPAVFRRLAVSWLTFLNALVIAPGPTPSFHELIEEFSKCMRAERGFAEVTLKSYVPLISHFLSWYAQRRTDLRELSITDVDDFIALRRSAGWKPLSLSHLCTVLRTFVGFAESQGWCPSGIRRNIQTPRVLKCGANPKGTPWSDVQRLIRSTRADTASAYKAHAVVLLCAVYGFRASEVTRLTLDDIDWRNEVLTMRRSKRGRVQQFPLQYEVGEALIRYLRRGRPNCPYRDVFITRGRPYRPLRPQSCWDIVSRRMRALGGQPGRMGPHALRHACATQLLKKGCTLGEIADYLGHRGMRTVSVYAKSDLASLKDVANFSLKGVV